MSLTSKKLYISCAGLRGSKLAVDLLTDERHISGQQSQTYPSSDVALLALVDTLQDLPDMLLPLQIAEPQERLQLQLVQVCEFFCHWLPLQSSCGKRLPLVY